MSSYEEIIRCIFNVMLVVICSFAFSLEKHFFSSCLRCTFCMLHTICISSHKIFLCPSFAFFPFSGSHRITISSVQNQYSVALTNSQRNKISIRSGKNNSALLSATSDGLRSITEWEQKRINYIERFFSLFARNRKKSKACKRKHKCQNSWNCIDAGNIEHRITM